MTRGTILTTSGASQIDGGAVRCASRLSTTIIRIPPTKRPEGIHGLGPVFSLEKVDTWAKVLMMAKPKFVDIRVPTGCNGMPILNVSFGCMLYSSTFSQAVSQ